MRSPRVGTADFGRPTVLGAERAAHGPAPLTAGVDPAGDVTDRRRTALADGGLPLTGLNHVDHAPAMGPDDFAHPHAGYVVEAKLDRPSRHRLVLGRA
ncbi:hypothetical protein OG539_41425 [Actinacidiphila glaucinigra]|uniref:hypothetical protein n=1 Tax=Actinacidiphila glaucinigra TaxID=235986 RepID=UPI002DD88135|nr:hypothetical protein [Actinacidiphila glaucinigra]WSD57787.1 hypothetical protein OIE69_02060 [Actinacidiphila glaucinigra]